MSRLGDLIRTERIRQKLTPKQVAKKCGVSESYLLAVEAGTKIIADDQARRILKSIGLKQQTEAEFTLDDIAATVDLAQVQPRMAAAVQPAPVPQARVKSSTPRSKVMARTTDSLTGVTKVTFAPFGKLGLCRSMRACSRSVLRSSSSEASVRTTACGIPGEPSST